MARGDVHATLNGRTLCGAKPRINRPFRTVPMYRGPGYVDCPTCLKRWEKAESKRMAANDG